MQEILRPALGKWFTIQCQVPVSELIGKTSRLIADFVIRNRCGTAVVCVFELDSGAHHFVDSAQIDRDRRKDRLLDAAGIAVHRFLPDVLDYIPATRRLVRAIAWRSEAQRFIS